LGDSKPAAGLYIVATPLGNALDMTLRAIAILRGADVIAAEDTRVTQKLLAIYGIKTPLISYHDHNEREMAGRLAHNISAGKSVALVSDAGTPLISDPGYRLLQSCIAEQLPIHVVPGPSAVISAIAVSGLPPLPFQFCGFIPPRGRKNKLAELKSIPATHVFFESALRLVELLHDIESVMGNVPTSIARELTKKFEEVRRGPISDMIDYYTKNPPRGEVTVMISTVDVAAENGSSRMDDMLRELLPQMSLKKAVAQTVEQTGMAKRVVYGRALELQKTTDGE
jgi:16S rRNA (cytidine1402-2'-O)-methyltransferase